MFLFYIKICFFGAGAGAGRSRAFMCGAGADISNLEPEPKKKISGAGAEENGSAPQHCLLQHGYTEFTRTCSFAAPEP